VTLCRGADGIGKTRTFRHLRTRAHARDVAVYETYNYDVEGIPLKPFLHTIRDIIRDLDIGAVLIEKYRYALEALAPELYGATPDERVEPPSFEEKIRVFDGIAHLLIEVSLRKPLLILVHDLHWGDLATVELLRYIGRNVQLCSELSARGARRAELRLGYDVTPLAAGPELDGFDSDEWRVLAPRPVAPHVYGSWLDDIGEAGAQDAFHSEPARLMVFANYRARPWDASPIEDAIESLGEESFCYHSELLPLDRAEVERSVEGVAQSGTAVEVTTDGMDALHEVAQGFPSFQHELFRGLFLRGVQAPWNRDTIVGYVDSAIQTSTGDGIDESTAARRRVLVQRLSDVSPEELSVLEVLALARRPVRPALVEGVLAPSESATVPTGDGQAWRNLRVLEEKGLVERREPNSTSEGEETYFFRLWDYTEVVEKQIDSERGKQLHERLAAELLKGFGEGAESSGVDSKRAYELYYHTRRGPKPLDAVPFGVAAAELSVRSLALEKGRSIYLEVLELVESSEGEDLLPQRIDLLERTARLCVCLRDAAGAETYCRQIHSEEKGALTPADRVRLLVLEADAVGELDSSKGLRLLNKAQKSLEADASPAAARVYVSLARIRLARQDWKRATNFALKGLAVCQKLEEKIEEGAELYQLVGRAFYRKGDYRHANENYQRGLAEAESFGARRLQVSILDELGRAFLERGQYFRSARFLFKALEMRRADHDVVGLCSSYDQLALCYQRNGDYLKTIENLNRSLHLKERIGDIEALNPTLGTLGDLYFRLGYYNRAIVYFRREMDNSRSLKSTETDETAWLADSFVRLGRVYFELGETKQALSLCTQASILASEFKLKSLEADSLMLEGNLRGYDQDWTPAEKSLRSAAEMHTKLGHRRREACAQLDLADVKFAREQYDEALKLASKAHLVADAIKAVDLQVRSFTIKGNVHRFLKGGNAEKVQENLGKGLELSQNLSDAMVLFQLFYSLAKVYHADREFSEAANYYGKAESLIKRVVENLPEELATRYSDDRRRRVFHEDLLRFRKEATTRSSLVDVRERSSSDLREKPTSAADYKNLLERVLQAHESVHELGFFERLLAEAVELTGGDRGVLLRVRNREYRPISDLGFGKDPQQHPEFAAAGQLAEESIRRGRSILIDGSDEEAAGRFVQAGALSGRSLIAVPLMTDERIFGGLYIDRPAALGRFTPREEQLVEILARHLAVALQNRRR
ncbi:MAG: GAF domain-containing protein, partial [Planctomycetota bacterium]